VTLTPSQTAQVTISQLRFVGGQLSPQPVGGTVFSWDSPTRLVADVDQSGLITVGNVAGQVTISVRVSSVPEPYLLGTPLNVIGDSIHVTNSGGGGGGGGGSGGGFRVSDITGPGTPITQSGFYTLTAVPVNQPPNTDLLIKWTIDYSNTPGSITTGYLSSTTYTLSVPEGSYSIEVTAAPRAQTAGGGWTPGTSRIEQFPVCTGSGGGGGGGPYLTSEGGAGGPTTTAVEGC